MREQNLKAIQPKGFKPKTTDFKGVKAVPNLLAAVKREECAPYKLIIGDTTYIPLRAEKELRPPLRQYKSVSGQRRFVCGLYKKQNSVSF